MSAFDPAAVAVVGASADPSRIGGRFLTYLRKHGFDGALYPVNPSHDRIDGLPCHSSIADVPASPDVALVVVPAKLVVDVVEDCYDADVETVVVISSGFAETGTEWGEEAEARLAELAAPEGRRLIGPNSQGIMDVRASFAGSFTPALQRESLTPGGFSFVTQSGAFGGALTTLLLDAGVGLNRWASTGNEAATSALDLVAEFVDDDHTDVVGGYVEGFSDGRRLVELKRTRAGIETPVVLLKVGSSDRGRAAAQSHTGTVAGDHAVYEAVFRETGVIAVEDVDAFVDVARVVTTLDEAPGPRLGVVTTSGGAGVHIADEAEARGLELAPLTDETRAELESHIPAYGSATNPVDITAQVVSDASAFDACLDGVLSDPTVDTAVVQITNIGGERGDAFAERVVDRAARADVPVLVSWTGGIEKETALARYRDAGVPVFENPARLVRAVAHLVDFEDAKDALYDAADLPARVPQADAARDAPDRLTETSAKELLAEHGIAVPRERLVPLGDGGADEDTESAGDAAVEAAREIGFPVVLKLVSPDLHHRSRVGGVVLDVEDDEDVRAAVRHLSAVAAREDVAVEGFSVQEQVPGNVELTLGVTDSDFGRVLMFGRGGAALEAERDVSFRTVPVSDAQADRLLDEPDVPAWVLDDHRESLRDAVTALSTLVMANPWIREGDVNPLVVTADGPVAVDAVFLGRDEAAGDS